jgi:16S rRNA G966 N2-methylase RsmD
VRRLHAGDFDLIVVDPPYAASAAAEAIAAVHPLVAAGTRLIVEHATRHPAPVAEASLELRRTVTAGDSALSFYARAESEIPVTPLDER